MPRDVGLLLGDVLRFAAIARRLNANGTYLAYANDEKLRLATERCLSIVGEAFSQALRQRTELLLEISNLRNIISLRHRLIHAFPDISDALVWSVMENNLAELEIEVRQVLGQLNEEQRPNE